MSRLQEQYKNEIILKLKEVLGMSNAMSVPKIEKITINMGLGSALGDKKVLESALEELSLISSQKPITCLARKSVASFKLREGNAIGCKVTLRKERMYEFLDRLVNVAIPRIRDFRGLSDKSFDGRDTPSQVLPFAPTFGVAFFVSFVLSPVPNLGFI